MTATIDSSLQSAIAHLSVPGVMIGHRVIQRGDEHALMPQEAAAFAASVEKVRRASGAARIVARELLGQLGQPGWPVVKGPAGAPIWPAGIVGSLAHDDRVAIATVAKRDAVAALGIDVEPAELLPPDLLELVTTPQERMSIADDPYRGRLLFVAKEAVYKAVHPLDQTFLEHHDVEVSLADGKATLRNGRIVEVRVCISSHLIVLAFIPRRR
jgi:4'-phosphopantetheinyl transferase EntD